MSGGSVSSTSASNYDVQSVTSKSIQCNKLVNKLFIHIDFNQLKDSNDNRLHPSSNHGTSLNKYDNIKQSTSVSNKFYP